MSIPLPPPPARRAPVTPNNANDDSGLIYIGMALLFASFVAGSAMLPIVSGLLALVSLPCLVAGIIMRKPKRRS